MVAKQDAAMNQESDKYKVPFAAVNVVAALATLLVLYRSHIPGGSDSNGIGLLIWIAVAPVWFVLVMGHRKASAKNSGTSKPSKLSKRRLLILPTLVGLSVLPVTQLPQFLFFTLFRHYLDTAATEALKARPASSPSLTPKSTAGPFPIFDVCVDGKGSVWIATTIRKEGFSPFFLVDGFVYNPSGKDTPYGHKYYDKTGPLHMKDDWYTFQAANDY